MNPASNTDAKKSNAHRLPCIDGDVCGEDAHCPPATPPISDAAVEAAARSIVTTRWDSSARVHASDLQMARAALAAALPFLTAEKDANTGEPSNERIPELVEGLMAQRDEALERVERLKVWKSEAMTVMTGLQELGGALGISLGQRITGPEALKAVESVKAERDEAQAEVARLKSQAYTDGTGWRNEVAKLQVSLRREVNAARAVGYAEGVAAVKAAVEGALHMPWASGEDIRDNVTTALAAVEDAS